MVILHKSAPGLNERGLARFLGRASRAAGLRGTVDILVTSSRELRALNRRFRGKDAPTDVLSFPAHGHLGALAGELAISVDIAIQSSRRLGHNVSDEIRILILHGVLHLAGYDHEFDHGEMHRKETRLRKKLGLPDGLIERSNGMSNRRPAQARRNHAGNSRGRNARPQAPEPAASATSIRGRRKR